MDDRQVAFRHDLRNYLTGCILALVLTAAAFWVVLSGGFGATATLVVVGVLGVVQLAVHLRFFLHVDSSHEKRENLDLILFSSLVLLIIVLGTAWVLGNLAMRMHAGM